MFCSNCGTQIAQSESFCPNCGNPVHTSESTENAVIHRSHKRIGLVIVAVIGVAVIIVSVLAMIGFFKNNDTGNAVQANGGNGAEEKWYLAEKVIYGYENGEVSFNYYVKQDQNNRMIEYLDQGKTTKYAYDGDGHLICKTTLEAEISFAYHKSGNDYVGVSETYMIDGVSCYDIVKYNANHQVVLEEFYRNGCVDESRQYQYHSNGAVHIYTNTTSNAMSKMVIQQELTAEGQSVRTETYIDDILAFKTLYEYDGIYLIGHKQYDYYNENGTLVERWEVAEKNKSTVKFIIYDEKNAIDGYVEHVYDEWGHKVEYVVYDENYECIYEETYVWMSAQ